mgnify:CR=1 FL=1
MQILDGKLVSRSVREQIKNVMEALSVKAVKTGFLVNADIVETVADALKDHRMVLIVDATVAAPGKHPDSNMLQAMKNSLLPLANMITANVAEAEYLLDCKLANTSDLIEAAKSLAAAYQCNVLLKTGFAADNNGRFSESQP